MVNKNLIQVISIAKQSRLFFKKTTKQSIAAYGGFQTMSDAPRYDELQLSSARDPSFRNDDYERGTLAW
jgi:hypothetical protein